MLDIGNNIPYEQKNNKKGKALNNPNNKMNRTLRHAVQKMFLRSTANSMLFTFSTLIISQSVLAEVYQSNGWQCQSIEAGKWNCAVADGPLAPKPGTADNLSKIPEPAAAVVAVKPSFPKPDFSTPETSPTGGRAVIKPLIKPRSPVLADSWSSCAVQPLEEYDRSAMAAQADETTNIEADDAQSADKDLINFNGNVVITKNFQKLTSDKASYNKTSSTFNAEGNVVITEPNMILKGDSARYQTDERKGRIDNAAYELPARPAQGVADNIRFKPGTFDLENPTYSTCPDFDQDWVLSASDMELHTDEGYGEARHAVMRYKGFPIAYTPYISFPLNDERRSGFLMPDIGYSDANGFELATPYYFNIAPDQDATVTPQILSDRGLMLGGEYRYLSENHSGEVYAEWLNDSSYDDKREAADVAFREGKDNIGTTDPEGNVRPDEISKNRGAFSLQQRANWKNGWSGNIDYNYVSDNYYLDDFANNLRDKSNTQLIRDGQLKYNGDIFNFMARTQGYQELQDLTHTYSRLPQLTLSANETFSPYGVDLDTGFDSEFVMFAQNWDDYQDERVEASRLHIKPSISIPFKNSYSFVKPKLSLDLVTYKLDNEDKFTAGITPEEKDYNIQAANWDDDSPSRAAPIFSLDSGLFFEKNLSLFDLPMQQTLEPRLFYLYTPEKDQDDIPLFDSGLSSFSFNQLFRENRFTGVDRLGDANQLSAAVTTRFIDDGSGAELFTASIGQIYYFEDREVTLDYDNNGDPIQDEDGKDTDSSSSIAAEITSQFAPNWYTSYSLLYDPHNDGVTDEARYRLQYKSDRDHIANLDYSYRAQDYEQVEMSAYWKIAPQWRALAHWYYSIYDSATAAIDADKTRDGYTLDSKIGIEYDSCCYALRFIVGREQDNYYADADNYVMLQLQFKGLGSLSQSIAGGSQNLEEDIPGFEAWKN
ncbi:MAG: LPS-assembly protein LptD [gamma proteobacterium symbiont of Lucinoma myriamae]|nr:LPS-assembly protein LptD [gamma proteobacterium symbiont of Lucinoma myriamae]